MRVCMGLIRYDWIYIIEDDFFYQHDYMFIILVIMLINMKLFCLFFYNIADKNKLLNYYDKKGCFFNTN